MTSFHFCLFFYGSAPVFHSKSVWLLGFRMRHAIAVLWMAIGCVWCGVLNKVPIDINNQMNWVSERVQIVEMCAYWFPNQMEISSKRMCVCVCAFANRMRSNFIWIKATGDQLFNSTNRCHQLIWALKTAMETIFDIYKKVIMFYFSNLKEDCPYIHRLLLRSLNLRLFLLCLVRFPFENYLLCSCHAWVTDIHPLHSHET